MPKSVVVAVNYYIFCSLILHTLFQNVIELKRRLNDILEKAVENGETTLISEIQAELSKTRTEVVE